MKQKYLIQKLREPYTPSYPGGPTAYIDHVEAILYQLEALDENNQWTDGRMRSELLTGVTPIALLQESVLKCIKDSTMSFRETAATLREDSVLLAALEGPSNHNQKLSSFNTVAEEVEEEVPWLDYNACVVLVNTMVSETSYSHVYNALSSPTLREKLYIPGEIWKCLESSLR